MFNACVRDTKFCSEDMKLKERRELQHYALRLELLGWKYKYTFFSRSSESQFLQEPHGVTSQTTAFF
jgi:hypothetical protein